MDSLRDEMAAGVFRRQLGTGGSRSLDRERWTRVENLVVILHHSASSLLRLRTGRAFTLVQSSCEHLLIQESCQACIPIGREVETVVGIGSGQPPGPRLLG